MTTNTFTSAHDGSAVSTTARFEAAPGGGELNVWVQSADGLFWVAKCTDRGTFDQVADRAHMVLENWATNGADEVNADSARLAWKSAEGAFTWERLAGKL
jgi:hypothetical protein